MSFNDLGLSPKVLSAVEAAGYTDPTPIQREAIPHVLARRDVLGIAQTGTGKTAAFTLPMLTLLESGRARARMPRTLILEPTRELAAQVVENFDRYGVNHKLNVALIIGGVSFGDQDAKIMRGVDVLIATPGRLLDHVERGKLLLSGIELLVIDEADRMLDMGFIPDIERIVKQVPFTRQTLFFSATMPPEITRLADQFLSNPHRVEVSRPASTADTIAQHLVTAPGKDEAKREVLRRLIREADGLTNAIVFCNRKREVALLHKSLERHGFSAAALHGDMDQPSRTRALDGFRAGNVTLLIASDVAARGLDIPAVSHIFNFDVPHHAEDYVHRIGRTGRAGRAGTAYTIATKGDEKSVSAIEKLIGKPIPHEAPSAQNAGEGSELEAVEPVREAARGRRGRGAAKRDESVAEPVVAETDAGTETVEIREAGTEEAAPREGRGRRTRSEGRTRQGGDPAPVHEASGGGRGRSGGRRRAEPTSATEVVEAPRPERARRSEQAARAEPSAPAAVPERSEPTRVERSRRSEPEPRAASDPRERRPERSREDEGPAVRGLGDHVPSFLMRPTRAPAKVD